MIGGLSTRQTTMAICENNKNYKHAPLSPSDAGHAAVEDPGHRCDDFNPT
jgi:hypothetical protein